MGANRGIALYRALFGLGFVVLGVVTAVRIGMVPAPASNKVLGVMLAIVMIALGGVRIGQYLRARRGPPA
ncbi:MAG TPA: hypothetical protein VFE70_03040 [Candidatus Elarobacter sp.]|nr:hypothetical protein [Candidatus Elarobacter sp.]